MKILISETATFGPFSSIEQMDDRWRCDGADFPFTVVGEARVEEYVPPEPIPEPEPPAPPRHITKLAFRNRFTTQEKVGIDLASIDDPSADMALRQQAATVRVSLADAAAASYIDLGRDDTRAGVMLLETAGILGAGRALDVLDAEIKPDERVQ